MLLQVKNLRTEFKTQDGIVKAVDGITFDLDEGQTLGIVGESGCGKSVSVLTIMRLIPMPPGRIGAGSEVYFDGVDVLALKDEEMRQVRGNKMAMIFQDPMTSLNPVLTIEYQVSEALQLHLGMNRQQARARTLELLKMVGIPEAEKRLNDYPHQFSGGMRQRVMIAMALACNPQLLIADEPTTALDVTIQAQILDLVRRLQKELGTAVIWITHDLGVVAGLCENVVVMYAGKHVESGSAKQIYGDPRHPYTKALLGSLPRLDAVVKEKLIPIEGLPPDLIDMPPGCPFSPRCDYAIERCFAEGPSLAPAPDSRDHRFACWVDVKSAEAQERARRAVAARMQRVAEATSRASGR